MKDWFPKTPQQQSAQEAMDAATKYFESRGAKVEDVSSQRKPYDLVITLGDNIMYLEVKGVGERNGTVYLEEKQYVFLEENCTARLWAFGRPWSFPEARPYFSVRVRRLITMRRPRNGE